MKSISIILFCLISLAGLSQKLDTTALSSDERIAWRRIEGYRQRVLKGESMSKLAGMYTEDPGSAKTGGAYYNIAKRMFVPEYEKAAFSLKVGEVSEVFQTTYGFHFVQLIGTHDGLIDTRHILVTTNTNPK